MSDTPSLFSLTRDKLHMPLGLHRWVLLKNSYSLIPPPSCSTPSKTPPAAADVEADDDEAPLGDVSDTLIYPDVENPPTDASQQAQWFDSLWQELDDDDDEYASEPQPPVLAGEDDDDALISPLPSPMSSSDDLSQSYFSAVSLSYPYPFPVPYPPFHPPLISPCHIDTQYSPPPYNDPLPYFDLDDVEDLPVPDAIEDTSDDESESPTTPSLGRSAALDFVDPASVPLPREGPHVYSATDESFLQPFSFPFPNPTYPLLDEC